jgi:hypothetical protein
MQGGVHQFVGVVLTDNTLPTVRISFIQAGVPRFRSVTWGRDLGFTETLHLRATNLRMSLVKWPIAKHNVHNTKP